MTGSTATPGCALRLACRFTTWAKFDRRVGQLLIRVAYPWCWFSETMRSFDRTFFSPHSLPAGTVHPASRPDLPPCNPGFLTSDLYHLTSEIAIQPSFSTVPRIILNQSLIPCSHLFPLLSNSCALFCTQKRSNSFVFNRFRTLCAKHPGVGASPVPDAPLCETPAHSASLRHPFRPAFPPVAEQLANALPGTASVIIWKELRTNDLQLTTYD